MTGNKEWLCSLKNGFDQMVKLGNNTKMSVVAKGRIKVQVSGISQVISDVYYVHELKNNLLSIGQLQENGLAILIQKGTRKVYHVSRGLVMETSMSGNRIFYVIASQPQKDPMCLQTEEVVEKEAHMWH